MRSLLALAASAVAGLAAAISSLDGDPDLVPFFVGLTFLGGLAAWGTAGASIGWPRRVAQAAALVWLGAAVWAAVLLVMSVTMSLSPPRGPEATYVGLTATVYHVIGLFGGAALVVASAFTPDRWVDRQSDREPG